MFGLTRRHWIGFGIGIALIVAALIYAGIQHDSKPRKDNAHVALDYFQDHGLTAKQAAGLDANLVQESAVNPNAKLTINNLVVARGVAMWTTTGRWKSLERFAATNHQSATDLTTQLDFIMWELDTQYPELMRDLKATTDVADATTVFERGYVQSGVPMMDRRIQYANKLLASTSR
jgi:hypothetical protein